MKSAGDRGFTLLELLIVVLLLALVLAVSYPSLSRGSDSIRLRSTGRDVLNAFRYAREKAVTEQIGMKITIDRAKQTLVMTNDLGDGSRTYTMPDTIKLHRIALGGSDLQEGPISVRFLPNGSSDRVEVTLKSSSDAVLRIISDPITGGARIEHGAGDSFR
jgi:prepilin-type N-terminal cleavage/methylation domain-containing protein